MNGETSYDGRTPEKVVIFPNGPKSEFGKQKISIPQVDRKNNICLVLSD